MCRGYMSRIRDIIKLRFKVKELLSRERLRRQVQPPHYPHYPNKPNKPNKSNRSNPNAKPRHAGRAAWQLAG